jgi:hypothetical protein
MAKVVEPTVVEVQSICPAGDNLDLEQYNTSVEMMHGKFKQLFMQ